MLPIDAGPTQTSLPNGWKRKKCSEQKVNDLIVEKFTALVRDGYERATNYKSTPGLASKGFWYANTNYKALQEIEKQPKPRLKFIKEKGSFYFGFPPKGFTHLSDGKDPKEKMPYAYALQENTLPSEGLKSAKESFSFIDCQILMEIAYYDALLEIAGEDKFNRYFDPKGEHPLALRANIGLTPLNDFFEVLELSKAELKKGDHVYFSNVPLYATRHLFGEAKGYHAICIEAGSEPKFTAFGLSPDGATEEQMYAIMVDDFNITPLAGTSLVTEDLFERRMKKITEDNSPDIHNSMEKAKTATLTKQTIKLIHEMDPSKAGLRPFIWRLNIDMIHRLL